MSITLFRCSLVSWCHNFPYSFKLIFISVVPIVPIMFVVLKLEVGEDIASYVQSLCLRLVG